MHLQSDLRYSYSWASLDARLFNSSLYLVATFESYLVFGSLLFNAAVPPFDWKNFVADSLPPTFIIRNWSHCHSRLCSVFLLKLVWWCTYGQGWWIAQKRYGHPSCGGSRSSQGRGIFQRVQMSKWDSFAHSRSISTIHIPVSNCKHRDTLTSDDLTLFAGLVFNFSKIFWDCDLEAIEAIFTGLRWAVVCATGSNDRGREWVRFLLFFRVGMRCPRKRARLSIGTRLCRYRLAESC